MCIRDRLNSCENQLPIDYACGWALSSDDMACTMQMLLDDADAYMYKNKQDVYKRQAEYRPVEYGKDYDIVNNLDKFQLYKDGKEIK